MLKKIVIGVLLLSVLGAGGAAFAYNATQPKSESGSLTPEPLANGRSYGSGGSGSQIGQAGSGEPYAAAQGAEGEPWQADGTIVAVDDYGFDFATQDGETVYIELGPPDYWQSQGVVLEDGQSASVTGSINAEMIHATQVVLDNGQVLQLRTEIGQPLWSGGAANNQGQNGNQGNGSGIREPQVQVDEWITYEGTLMSFQGGNMTMGTNDGELVAFQTGQPRFFAEQGVTFQVGDEILVLGFYDGEQFMAGEITQVSTGLRVMLRDPNGRPLWAGPGGNGNGGNGGGNGNKGGNGHGGNF